MEIKYNFEDMKELAEKDAEERFGEIGVSEFEYNSDDELIGVCIDITSKEQTEINED